MVSNSRARTLGGLVWLRVILAVVVRPHLWWTALRQGIRMTRPGWWRRAPYLPVPEPAYLSFRLETVYGRDAPVCPRDLVAYLEWCRQADTARRRA
jgi:hypothetical protein